MRIAYVVHDYHRSGGHSRYVVELASRFAADHEVHVFANTIEHNGPSSIHFHSVPAWRANALTTVLSFAIPVSLQIGSGFDIVHSQGFCGLRGNVFTGHMCNRAWHKAIQGLEGRATWRETVFDAVGSTLERGLYRFSRNCAVIAISKRVAADIVRFYHCPAPMHVIYHGVDLDMFSPAHRSCWRPEMRFRYGISDDEIVYLYVGDLRKGAGRCIRALAHVEHGKLLLISRTRTAAYERLADEAGVRERSLFLGPTNQAEKAYAAADVFLLPTPYDAFGMVISEAMASGLPVIVSREAGASELILHGDNGLLLDDAASIEELAGYMSRLQDRPWAARLGAAARTSVESMSWDAVATQTMRVYEELVQSVT